MKEPNAVCQHCGNPYWARPHRLAQGLAKFCSWECAKLGGRRNYGKKNPNWKGGWTDVKRKRFVKTCEICSREFETSKQSVKYCSKSCAAHGCKKGPKVGHRGINSSGYVVITQPDGSRALEHRLVWEATHGPIPPRHVIHHINRDRTDNRLENLQLLSAGEHSTLHNREDQKQPIRMARCHPDRRQKARGLCGMCYQREFRAKKLGLPSLLRDESQTETG